MSDAKTEPLFEINLIQSGHVFRPTKFSQFVSWVRTEKDKWQWLDDADDGHFPPHVRNQVRQQLQSLVDFAVNMADRGSVDNDRPDSFVNGTYGGVPSTLIHSTSETGRAVLALHEKLGADVAAVAYGVMIGQIAPSWTNPVHTRAVFLVANPSLIAKEAIRAANKTDYADWRTRAEALLISHDARIDERDRTANILTQEAQGTARRTLRLFMRRNLRLRGSLTARADQSVSRIDNVRAAYEEGMKLRASVQYWGEKKADHSARRGKALAHLGWFSVAACVVSALLFWFAISFMLEASGVNVWEWMVINPPKGRTVALSTYVIVTGAVGTILTVLFWTARILVRNYLTERRLEGDAEERRIMTQTYLALIGEGAANDEDRLVILNALFRPSPDHPNSDDGGNDIALPAILAKLMDQRLAR